MREIKFRGAWHDTCGNIHWAYGLLSYLEEGHRHIEPGWFISNKVGMAFAYGIDPQSIGQFTGLKGVNKKDIYESDIVRYKGSDIVWQVCYDRWGIPALARVDYPMSTDFKEMEVCHNLTPAKCEVIGNIYESPELLKENK